MQPENFYKTGHNCWRIEQASKVAFLIDGADYFYALREALKNAQQSVLIIGWDICSDFALVRPGDHPGSYDPDKDDLPAELGPLLNKLVERSSSLTVNVLNWDFSVLYANGREWFTQLKMDWITNPRLHFRVDNKHPTGASQHQKFVVIDDKVAFVGGLDITRGRWDTSDHRANDSRREELGEISQPFHDVQIALEGNAAKSLGDLARERWREATAQELPIPDATNDSPWPQHLAADMQDAELGISRTMPTFRDREAIQEIQQLLIDAIYSAKKSIYLENQYLTADSIGAALSDRLQDKDGPEVIIILPYKTDGWLSQFTMDVIRERLLARLKKADHYHRLKVLYPHHESLGGITINVHAKVLIVDNCFARVGSANFNNRSLGLDSECDVSVCVNSQNSESENQKKAIDHFQTRLIAEHLDHSCDRVAEQVKQLGGWIPAIEALQGNDRTLKPLPEKVTPEVDRLVPETDIVDPIQPIDPSRLMTDLLVKPRHRPLRQRFMLFGSLFFAIFLVTALWHWTPLNQWLDLKNLMLIGQDLKQSPFGPILFVLGATFASLFGFPITILIALSMLLFDPILGVIFALASIGTSALSHYWGGHVIGRNRLNRIAGKRLKLLQKKLKQNGVLAVFAVRIIPVAPYVIVNLAMGALGVKWHHYILGTLLGFLPGTLALAIFSDRIEATLKQPDLTSVTSLVVASVVIIASIVMLKRWLKNRTQRSAS